MNAKTRNFIVFGAAAVLLLAAAFFALRFGSVPLSSDEFWGGMLGKEGYHTYTLIFYSSRLPRVLGAVLAGIAFSQAGTLLQRVTDNPLASPSILGINAGAGFAVLLLLVCFPLAYAALPLAAFAGALLATFLILGVARSAGMSRTVIVLAGVALSALFQAGISFLSVIDPDALASYVDFSVGGLHGVTMDDLLFPALLILACLVVSQLLSRKLALFCLGDTLAGSLGVPVKRVRLLSLIAAAASAAAAVSFTGLIGFVGLIVPHTARTLVKGSMRGELCLAPMLGAALLLIADLFARTLFAPTEIPVGVFTALLGVPFFLALVVRRKRHV